MKQSLPVINEPSPLPEMPARVLVPQSSEPGRHDVRWLLRQVGHAAWSVKTLLTQGLPPEGYYFFGGIGDVLLCSAVFHELRRRGHSPVRMMSQHNDLFLHNPDVAERLAVEPRLIELGKRLGRRLIAPEYALPYIPEEDRHPAPPYPIIARMCETVGITGEVSIRPYMYLTDDEKSAGRVARRQVAVISSGMSAHHQIANKQWYPERFQAVVDSLADRFDFVQLGHPSDPPLAGALDLRGKTTLRESAAILSQSLAFLGQIGLLMHVARAVDCRSVIVYGGREHPDQSGYISNENLYTPLPCAPCWKLNACDYDHECMRRIQPSDVTAALERTAARYGTALETDTYTVPERL
jgi:ADP-heptose:LPS heptosyltransferase